MKEFTAPALEPPAATAEDVVDGAAAIVLPRQDEVDRLQDRRLSGLVIANDDVQVFIQL